MRTMLFVWTSLPREEVYCKVTLVVCPAHLQVLLKGNTNFTVALIASSTDYFAPKKWLPSNCPRLQPQAPLTQATCWEEVHQLAAPSGAPHKHQPLAPAIFQSSYFGPDFFGRPGKVLE